PNSLEPRTPAAEAASGRYGRLAERRTSAKLRSPAKPDLNCPGNGGNIVVPPGYTVSAFAKGLNFPTGVAFQGSAPNFKVYVLPDVRADTPAVCAIASGG